MVDAPTFMFGYERSGTTLLSMIAGAHPDLAVPLSVTGLWFTQADNLDEYRNTDDTIDVERLVCALCEHERIRLWDESLSPESVLPLVTEPTYGAVVNAFHRAYAARKGKQCWANLDIGTLDDMPRVLEWFPEARFVHIVRDGRDVALSHETMPYGESNTWDCALSWRERVGTNLKMGAMLGKDRYLVLRYEDLVLDTSSALARLCQFLGLEYSEKMLDYTEMVDGKIPDDKRWLWPALDQKPQKSKCYVWKQRMDTKRRIVFEGEAGELLAELGYETYTDIPKSMMAYLYEQWCFLGRKGRFRRVRKKLGLSNTSKLEREWSGK